MSTTARFAIAGDRFLDKLAGDLDIYSSKAKLIAARIIAAALWLLVCCYAFIYFFVASLPIIWDGSVVSYIGAGVFILIFLNCLMILAALVASALRTRKVDFGRLDRHNLWDYLVFLLDYSQVPQVTKNRHPTT